QAAGVVAQQVQEPEQALALGTSRGLAVDGQLVRGRVAEADLGIHRQAVEGDREAARGGQVERGVTLPPVLDEGDVDVGARGDWGPEHFRAPRLYPFRRADARPGGPASNASGQRPAAGPR